MAVQAQYPSNAFPPVFRTRIPSDILHNTLEGGAEPHQHRHQQQIDSLSACNHATGQQQKIINGSAFSDPQSDLTCNVLLAPFSGPMRKRTREDDTTMVVPQPIQQSNLSYSHLSRFVGATKIANSTTPSTAPATAAATVSGYEQQNRLQGSAGTSTSGRPVLVSPIARELVSLLYHQSMEIDALIRLQSENLRSGLEDVRKRHCRGLLSVLEQQAAKRLKEKEAELASAALRNAELEEKVKQLSTEGQVWFNVAKNNEAIATSLRATLEQVLLQNAANGQAGEGYGDSGPADDAQSCCFEERKNPETSRELRSRRSCRVCQERDVSFLLLPCRHLCVCSDCDPAIDTCPICSSTKSASIQILMS